MSKLRLFCKSVSPNSLFRFSANFDFVFFFTIWLPIASLFALKLNRKTPGDFSHPFFLFYSFVKVSTAIFLCAFCFFSVCYFGARISIGDLQPIEGVCAGLCVIQFFISLFNAAIGARMAKISISASAKPRTTIFDILPPPAKIVTGDEPTFCTPVKSFD